MSFLYSIGMWLAFPGIWVAPLFSKKIRKFLNGRKGLVKTIENTFATVTDDVVWFHCSSVGEFEQARPLIEWYKGSRPQTRILLTFFSPSGYELRKNYSLADWVFYLPLDTISNAHRMVRAVKPKKLIFTKYDLWNNYIRQARKAGAGIYLVSAIFRRFQPFFKWWGGFFRGMLRCINVIFVQDEE